jgi:hypothetical protein
MCALVLVRVLVLDELALLLGLTNEALEQGEVGGRRKQGFST